MARPLSVRCLNMQLFDKDQKVVEEFIVDKRLSLTTIYKRGQEILKNRPEISYIKVNNVGVWQPYNVQTIERK